MTFLSVPKGSNDNKPHPLMRDLIFWKKKLDGDKPFFFNLNKTEFRDRERSLANFIWFYKFEYSFLSQAAEAKRSEFKVVT